MYEFVLYQVQEGICTITMNRPESYNALNTGISLELQDALSKVAADEQVRVVVLTGAGKAFSSGADLKAPIEVSFSHTLNKRYVPIILAMRQMPKPIIGRINGVAAGAGCSIALACDVLIASEEAVLSELFVGIALVMDAGSTYFLPRLVGTARAFELATTGRRVTAQEAFQIGMVNKVVAADQLDAEVAEMAQHYATAPTKTIGLIKQMLNKSLHMTLEEMMQYEGEMQDIAGNSTDFQEGVIAFLQKRKPEFKGK